MVTLKWHSMRLSVMTLALLSVMVLPGSADVVSGGPKVGQWKTWVLASGTEIQVPAPPAETSDQTKAELAELRQLQKEQSPSANTAIQYYNAVPATQRWHDLAFVLARAAPPQSPNRQARLAAILHTALHDAVIATWTAKYQFNRKPPRQMAPDVTQVAIITGEVSTLGAVVSVRARGDRRNSGRHSDGVFPERRGQREGHGHGVGADAAADGRELPQRHRCRVHTRPGSGAEGARPRRHRWLGRQVDRHGADRARTLGREEPAWSR